MGLKLSDINDPRLRIQIEHQLSSAEAVAVRTAQIETDTDGSAPDRESDLHDQIIDLCRSKGWFYVHSRMDRKSTIGVGCPDFCIAMPNGRTVWLECKRKGGKPTPAQNAALAMLRVLGHTAEVVTDMEQVRQMCGNDKLNNRHANNP